MNGTPRGRKFHWGCRFIGKMIPLPRVTAHGSDAINGGRKAILFLGLTTHARRTRCVFLSSSFRHRFPDGNRCFRCGHEEPNSNRPPPSPGLWTTALPHSHLLIGSICPTASKIFFLHTVMESNPLVAGRDGCHSADRLNDLVRLCVRSTSLILLRQYERDGCVVRAWAQSNQDLDRDGQNASQGLAILTPCHLTYCLLVRITRHRRTGSVRW